MVSERRVVQWFREAVPINMVGGRQSTPPEQQVNEQGPIVYTAIEELSV